MTQEERGLPSRRRGMTRKGCNDGKAHRSRFPSNGGVWITVSPAHRISMKRQLHLGKASMFMVLDDSIGVLILAGKLMWASFEMKKPYVVIGLGKTGLSCVRHFVAQGERVVVTDDRAIPPCLHALRSSFPDVPVYLDHYPGDLLAEAKALVVSPGVALSTPQIAAALAHGVEAIGDVELFVRHAKAPIVAITGSNGKSTVTSMVGDMVAAAGLSVQVGGNLGTPALDLLSQPVPDFYVLELSSFQLETTASLRAVASVVLNISPDHLDRYASYDDYVQAKKRIYHHCQHPIVNRDDAASFSGVEFEGETVSFGLDAPAMGCFGLKSTAGKTSLLFGEEVLLTSDQLPLRGRHQLGNALAALALGRAIDLPMPTLLRALQTFVGLPHRCQWIGCYDEVDWYNDSKATNVGAAQAAIFGLGQALRGKLILIAGGLGKQADFTPLRRAVEAHVRTAVLLGHDAGDIREVLTGVVEVIDVNSMQDAVNVAGQQARPGDAVLLAPACASFDMFEDFERRGDEFIAAVRSRYA